MRLSPFHCDQVHHTAIFGLAFFERRGQNDCGLDNPSFGARADRKRRGAAVERVGGPLNVGFSRLGAQASQRVTIASPFVLLTIVA